MGSGRNESIEKLIKKLGVEFKDRSLLESALLHRSYSSRHQIDKDNERLEFLGDSILNACVSDIIFKKFPEKNEGDLTKIRARLVSRKAMRRWGDELELEKYVKISEKMRIFMRKSKTQVVENAMEAVVGAVYLDSGFSTAHRFIAEYMERQDFKKIVDFKSRLQELSVERYDEFPEYELLSEEGPPHNKKFRVSVSIRGKVYGKGKGSSKKSAHQQAAREAYKSFADEYKKETKDKNSGGKR